MSDPQHTSHPRGTGENSTDTGSTDVGSAAGEQSVGDRHPGTEPFADPGEEPIVVGVTPGQCQQVVTEAARLAERIGATLICAYVEPLQRGVFEGAGGTMLAVPVDAEAVPDPTPFPETLQQRLLELTAPYAVECTFSRPVGEISIALGELAEDSGAHAIVVGTRRPGFRAGIAEFFAGSVAAHLTHRQPRPVLVIPVSPAEAHESLPWDEE